MSVFKQFFKSLYSPKDISRFRFQKLRKAVLYILLLSLLSVIPEMVQISKLLRTEILLAEETVNTDIPDFQIEQGELKAEVQAPVVKESDGFLFFFAPNTTEIPAAYIKDSGVFFMKRQVTLVTSTTTETYPYNLLGDKVVKKKDIEHFLDSVQSMLPMLLFALGTLLYLFDVFISFLSITLLAMLGQFMARQLQRNVKYKQAWVLCAYSTTIPTVFFMVMAALNTTVQASPYIFTFVTLFMMYLVLKEIPVPKKKEKMPL